MTSTSIATLTALSVSDASGFLFAFSLGALALHSFFADTLVLELESGQQLPLYVRSHVDPYPFLLKLLLLGFKQFLWHTLRSLLCAEQQIPQCLAELRRILLEEARNHDLELLDLGLRLASVTCSILSLMIQWLSSHIGTHPAHCR